MWWAGQAARNARAIQDRWRAAGLHLIVNKPTQMAIPLHQETSFPKTVGRCNVACQQAIGRWHI